MHAHVHLCSVLHVLCKLRLPVKTFKNEKRLSYIFDFLFHRAPPVLRFTFYLLFPCTRIFFTCEFLFYCTSILHVSFYSIVHPNVYLHQMQANAFVKHYQKLELVFPNSKTPHAFYRYYERIYFMFLFDNRGIFHQPLKNITATKATITSNTVRTMYIM